MLSDIKKHCNSGIGLKRILFYLGNYLFRVLSFGKDLLDGKYEIIKNCFAKQKLNLLIFLIPDDYNESKNNFICTFKSICTFLKSKSCTPNYLLSYPWLT